MFEKSLRNIDAGKIMSSLYSQQVGRFNENILRTLCVNKAINKFKKELNVLVEMKDHLIEKLEDVQSSDKLANFIDQMRNTN